MNVLHLVNDISMKRLTQHFGRNNETTAKLVFFYKSEFLFFLQTDLLTTHKTHDFIPNDTKLKIFHY